MSGHNREGSLLCSCLFALPSVRFVLGQLSLATGASVHLTIEEGDEAAQQENKVI